MGLCIQFFTLWLLAGIELGSTSFIDIVPRFRLGLYNSSGDLVEKNEIFGTPRTIQFDRSGLVYLFSENDSCGSRRNGVDVSVYRPSNSLTNYLFQVGDPFFSETLCFRPHRPALCFITNFLSFRLDN
jgi:hypothetical protein